ncbi:MAG TPA: class I SAM-dependent methyltransferase, partial [Candidatus Saccharimonadales bacterium]|nr:class I SAM-dependent methyltransferase [Candidatus Saccharimonadales bacterium]
MRKQQQIWLNEHESQDTLPALAESEPSSTVIQFVEYLKQQNIQIKGSAIDIGCGRGRNAVYLAVQGFEVYAVDYIEPALEAAQVLANTKGQTGRINFEAAEIDQVWPFADNFFEVAIDCFSSIDIETKTGREIYRDELLRTLKPGGYAMVAVVSADDEFEKQANPGSEPNSVIWPENGKFQKNYDEKELREFYKGFKILKLNKVR